MKTIIFVAALVLIAHATNLQNEMTASLADLGDHPFGKSMVSLLNLNMKTGTSNTE
jgi:phosphotransferase system HPr-like phosphotransfer protein